MPITRFNPTLTISPSPHRAQRRRPPVLTLAGSSEVICAGPPLNTSHVVAPKPHLSASKPSVWASWRHSGATQGILSVSTGGRGSENCHGHLCTKGPLCQCRPCATTCGRRQGGIVGEASLYSLSRLSTVGLTPGSLSLMKGGFPSPPSRARSTFRAETLP